jgi:hypothetical protein
MKNKRYLTSSLMYLFIATSMVLNHYGNTSLLDVTHILLWCITLSAIFIFSLLILVLKLTDSEDKFKELKGVFDLYEILKNRNKFDATFTTILELSVFVLYGWTYLILFYLVQEIFLLVLPSKFEEVINKYSTKE